MKRFILCMMLCASFMVATSQTTTDTNGVSKDVKYLTETLSQGVQNVAKDLHIMPNQVYDVMQKQVEVELYWSTVWIWLSIIIMIILIAAGIILNVFGIKYRWEGEAIALPWILITTLCLAFTIILVCNWSDVIQLTRNPEYWIYKQLLP